MAEAVDEKTAIPIVEEVAKVATREIETARMRVRTEVEESIHDITAQVTRGEIEIERRQVEREVASVPGAYAEGDLLIIPITEERAVVQKRLFVVEELVVRRVASSQDVHLPTPLRRMRAVIERDDPVPGHP